MLLSEILQTIKDRKRADLYVDIVIGGTTHFVQVIKAPFISLLQREFTPDEETGKSIFYNEHHDSLYIEATGKEAGTDGGEEAQLYSSDAHELGKDRSVPSRNDHSGRTRLVLNGRGCIVQDRRPLQD